MPYRQHMALLNNYIYKKEYYDIVIIGGGPCGLSIAHNCCNKGYKILIIDENDTIGGCHRVKRVEKNDEKIFTEHGPRIYSSSFVNFSKILHSIGYEFDDIFTHYNYSIFNTGYNITTKLQFRELFILFLDFISFIINPNYYTNISLHHYLRHNNFTELSYNLIDRICRLTDGGDVNKFSVGKFFNLINQQIFYNFYQPRYPNDKTLIPLWKGYLISKGVTFMTNTKIINLTKNNNYITNCITNKNSIIYGNKFILAIPPTKILELIDKSRLYNVFGDFNIFNNWANKTAYNTYISITFHWDTKLDIPKIHGFPYSEWGVIFIVLSDYTVFKEKQSKTVISASVSILDKPSFLTGKTADQSNKEELVKETFRQLQKSLKIVLPEPTQEIVNPNDYYNRYKSKWEMYDSAYINKPLYGHIPFNSTLANLYNVGTQNGKCKYNFTTIESAVTNGIAFSNYLFPRNATVIYESLELRDVIIYTIAIIIIICVIIMLLII